MALIKLLPGTVLDRLRSISPDKSYTPKVGTSAEKRIRARVASFLADVDLTVPEWSWIEEMTRNMNQITHNQVICAIAERAMLEDPAKFREKFGNSYGGVA